MPCATAFNDGFVCGRGIHGCEFCGKLSSYQCDAFVDPPGAKPRRRCNRYVCPTHATNLVPSTIRNGRVTGGKDACPDHAEACLAALGRAKSTATS